MGGLTVVCFGHPTLYHDDQVFPSVARNSVVLIQEGWKWIGIH